MSCRPALAATALCLLAPASAGASSGNPVAALSAAPSRIGLAGSARETIRLANPGASRIVVDVARAGFALDPRGRPQVRPAAGARSATRWLTAWPGRLSLAPHGTALLTVASRLPRRAEPGDHGALVLLTTRPAHAGKVAVQMRVGIVVTVRAPGRIVHRIEVRGLRMRRAGSARLLDLRLANRGNVTESLRRGSVRVQLLRGSRRVVTRYAPARDLLPRTEGLVELRYRGRVHGQMRAIATITPPPRSGRRPVRRSFAVRV